MSKVNGYDFKFVSDYLMLNHDKAYKAPKNARNAKEKEEMEKLYIGGKESNKIFNDKLSLLAEANGLCEIKNYNFLEGSFTKIRNYYWGQLKFAENYWYPQSISVFCEVVDNKQVRFRISLEIDDKRADKEDMQTFLRVLDKPIKESLCYMGTARFERLPKVLSLSKKDIKEKLKAGTYSKIQITYLAKIRENDEEMLRELDKGVKLLLPYYKFIMR